ncbi:hypothetical protein ACTSEZ_18265 [Metabacillus sp. JX24]|uniref:hypothetical protein n=1 Tax=Metabacillus sp. JX24 TaxID=3240759 RepID=UPI00350FDF62
MKPDSLFEILLKYEGNEMIIEWNSGLKIAGRTDTFYETNNGFDEKDSKYADYYATAFRVDQIITRPSSNVGWIYNWLVQEKSSLIEISLHDDPPSSVYLANGQCVWKGSIK